MNPIIYMGTQAKYRLAIKILFCGDNKRTRGSIRRSSCSEAAPGNGGAKFYVRQLSSSTAPELEELQTLDSNKSKNKGILKRQVSFK